MHHFTVPPTGHNGSSFSTNALILCIYLIVAILLGVKFLIALLIYALLLVSDVEYLFICSLDIYIIIFGEMSAQIFCHFSVGTVDYLWLFLYILDINSQIHDLQTFSLIL
jgi:hypothetical protein